MHIEIIGAIDNIETSAVGHALRDIERWRKQYGPGRWRKLKGIALVRLADGRMRRAEVHWYEAHGKGRRKLKVKYFLD